MRWLVLSSKVSHPRARLNLNASVKRRKKKSPPPSSERGAARKRGWKIITAILFLGGGGVVIGWLFHNSEMFVVNEIRVRNNHDYSPEEVIAMSGLETGGNIFKLDPASVRSSLLRHVDFRDANVQRIFPDTIRIDVMEREPRARVQYGQFYTIDDRGVILGPRKKGSGMQLPVIRGLRVKGGSLFPVDKRDACLRLLRELEEQDIGTMVSIEEIRVFSSDLIEMQAAGELEITLGQGDYQVQLERLKTVLNKLGPDVSRAREVDLRYSKIPVVFDD